MPARGGGQGGEEGRPVVRGRPSPSMWLAGQERTVAVSVARLAEGCTPAHPPTHLMQGSRPGLAPAQQRAHWSPPSLQTRKRRGEQAAPQFGSCQACKAGEAGGRCHQRCILLAGPQRCSAAGSQTDWLAGPPGCVVCSTKQRSGDSWRCTTTAMQADSWGTPAEQAGRHTREEAAMAGAAQQSALALPEQQKQRRQHPRLPQSCLPPDPQPPPLPAPALVYSRTFSHAANTHAHLPPAG